METKVIRTRWFAAYLFLTTASNGWSQPRHTDDLVRNAEQLDAIRSAVVGRTDVDANDVLQTMFPDFTFADFDRDRNGQFMTRQAAFGLFDYDLAVRQFLHDTDDLDGDGLPGFIELECQHAGGPILDPNASQSSPGVDDGATDCDLDGIPNLIELSLGDDPLSPDDIRLDSDNDGVSDAQEIVAGTPFEPVLELTRVAGPNAVRIDLLLNQPDHAALPILAEFILVFDPAALQYETALLGASGVDAGGKNIFAALRAPNEVRITIVSSNLQPMRSGALASIYFESTGAGSTTLTFDTENSHLSPRSAQESQTFGVGHPNNPLMMTLEAP